MTDATLDFLPWVRSGVAARIAEADDPAATLHNVATVTAHLTVDGLSSGQTPSVALRPYGPGDVTGLDPRHIVRRDPPAGTDNFEPNYFVGIEFDRPDLPWMLTPAAAHPPAAATSGPSPAGRLRPWLVLIVVEDGPGVTFSPATGQTPAVIEIAAPASPATELPDLSQSWGWAHTQVLVDGADVTTTLAQAPDRVVSRLLAPRRLIANRRYHACLVPAFAAGRQAALSEAVDGPDDPLRPAWQTASGSDATEVRLPVFDHWTFGTGSEGDFRSLARRLQPAELPDGAGGRALNVPSLTGGAATTTELEGALQSGVTGRAPLGDSGWAEAARALVNSDADTVAPPRYGSWYVDEPLTAGQTSATAAADVPAAGGAPPWLREVNTDPRERAAAGLGARVVDRLGDLLLSAAWAQLATLVPVRQLHHQAELAVAAHSRVIERHFSPLDPAALIALSAPAHSAIVAPGQGTKTALALATGATTPPSFAAALQASSYPADVAGASVRRALRGGPVARGASAAGATAAGLDADSLAGALTRSSPAAALASPPTGVVNAAAFTSGAMALDAVAPAAIQAAAARPAWQPVAFGASTSPAGPGPDSPAAARFRQAVAAQVQHAQTMTAPTAPPVTPTPTGVTRSATLSAAAAAFGVPASVRTHLLAELDPTVSLGRRLSARLGGDGATSTAAVTAKAEPVASTAPAAADPTAAAPTAKPTITRAMCDTLNELSARLLLPGADQVEPETVSAARTNPRFIEAFMVGANHHANRLLLWNGLPTDQRAMPFQNFWRGGDDAPPELPAIDTWAATSALGSHLQEGGTTASGIDGQLILVLRGELFNRHPGTIIYGRRAQWVAGERQPVPGDDAAHSAYPTVHAQLGQDVLLVGLFVDGSSDAVLDESAARGGDDPAGDAGWFFILQEHPSEPRFGLAADAAAGGAAQSWQDLGWLDLVTTPADLDKLGYVSVTGPLPDLSHIANTGGATWGGNGADMAQITLRLPYRVAMHARLLIKAAPGS